MTTVGSSQEVDVLESCASATTVPPHVGVASRDAGSADADVTSRGGVVTIPPRAAGTVSVTYMVANSDNASASGKITLTVSAPRARQRASCQ